MHVGSNVSHYVKVILDEVFGASSYINEVIWKRQTAHSDTGQGSRHMGRIHDVIFFYAKSETYTWEMQYTDYEQSYTDSFYRHVEPETGRRYRLSDITAPGGAKAEKGNPQYEFLGVTRYWRFSEQRMRELYEGGRIVQTRPGTVPAQKRYLDEMPGVPLQDIWADIRPIQSQASERRDYPTQKPETLLERIIRASSNEDDLVLDCFCGSGTTPAVAEKLGRRWIACDLGRFAVHTTRKRLLGIDGVRPFVVQNLGKYERQAWQLAEFENPDNQNARETAYRRFILELYHAAPFSGSAWLHGVHAGRFVHVGAVDAPVTLADVRSIVGEVWRAAGACPEGTGPVTAAADVLGWDFAFEMNEIAAQMAAEAKVDVRFKRIPREVLEKKAVDQGDIRFYELAALSVSHQMKQRTITLELTDFMIPPDDVPEDVRKSVTHWEQWLDYWAVDWDYRGDTFHNQWQSYRTRQDPGLQKRTVHTYEEPGRYTVLVKAIDILGNDTTKSLVVEVA